MEDLHRVEEAERFLRTLGYSWLRVRMHGDLARIEVAPEQRLQLLEQADTVVKTLRILGFRHVTMDLFGYRLGSMNPACSEGARSVSGEAAASDESPSTDSATQGAEHRLHPGVRVEPS
jgi:uncharacterized protein